MSDMSNLGDYTIAVVTVGGIQYQIDWMGASEDAEGRRGDYSADIFTMDGEYVDTVDTTRLEGYQTADEVIADAQEAISRHASKAATK